MIKKENKFLFAAIISVVVCISTILGVSICQKDKSISRENPTQIAEQVDGDTSVPQELDIIINEHEEANKDDADTKQKSPVLAEVITNNSLTSKEDYHSTVVIDKTGNSSANKVSQTEVSGSKKEENQQEHEKPQIDGTNVKVNVEGLVDSNNLLTKSLKMESEQGVQAVIPSGVKIANNITELELSIIEKNRSDSSVELEASEKLDAYDIHIEGIAADNTVPVIIELGQVLVPGLNKGNLSLYHVEDHETVQMTEVNSTEEFSAHNQFSYDPQNGELAVAMMSFSEVAVVSDTEAGWKGNYDYTWYDSEESSYVIANADQLAAFGAIVGGMNDRERDDFSGKTVKLTSDINLADDENNNNSDVIFYPIGYYNDANSYKKQAVVTVTSNVYSFAGTFDGNGHTISNFYQNTWEMFGDYNSGYSGTPNHYKDGMGLFGYVNGGTIKNLTVDNFSSDGEFTPTGVIAAYAANAAFENIAITNCNPRVYNTGNGGIVGVGGNNGDDSQKSLTFTNITIDNTNKISALWGSWDVACGGLMGMFRGKGNVNFTNCHIAAQIDVYNDVCGNYQYYWYRYAGMMIGSIRNHATDENGYIVPDTSNITASDCTVHFGEWNDYYYCELVANSLASYTHDHQFSRLKQVDSVDVENKTVTVDGETTSIPESGRHHYVTVSDESSTENVICYHFVNGEEWKHEEAGTETVNGVEVLKEDKQHVYLPFNQLFQGYGWGVKNIPIYNGEDYAFEGITILDREVADSVEKFETKFTGNFLYRVGNENTVDIGSLFEAKDGVEISDSGTYVTIDKVYEDSNVSGSFTPNTDDWTQGTIQFSGTGVVKVTIQDYNYCEPTELYLEVVDGVNATTATSVTAKDVVLLNDCGFSSFEVSNGYTLYGNGFTMTCGSDSVAKDLGYAFVTLEDGTLDNVQIVCPNFDYAALYKSNLTSSDNRSETDSSGTTRYYNAKSGVMASGNSQILNSRISGARAAVNVSGGNLVIDNSRIELGAIASVLVGAANSLTLRDVTLIQKPTASTYDSSKTLMGFSILAMCTSGGDAAPITLEGTLIQNAWVNENDKQYVPEDAQTIIDTVMGEEEYLHDIDGDSTNESLNLGIAYMPADGEYTVNTPSVTDNRTNKDTIPYDSVEVKYSLVTTYVYSYKNTNGTDDSIKTEGTYVPNTQSDIINVTYSDTSDGLTTGKSYGSDGWIYELNVDLDTLSGYELDFSKLSMTVNGVTVSDYKVNGSAKPTSPVAVTAGGTIYTMTAELNGNEYTVSYKVTGTETSKESPSLVASDYEAGLCVASSYGGTWHGAAPVLEGVQIKYWSVAEQQYKTITLSDYTPTTAGQQNGTNNYWTYTPDNGDFTLTIKNETAVHSGNSVYAMPVVCDSKLYFVASSSNGLVNTGNSARTIAITYYFNDNNNGDQLIFSNTWSVEENTDAEYKYSDFCSGTLTKLESSSSSCVTPETLITLADGTQKEVMYLSAGEKVLVWNLETGTYDTATIVFVDSEQESSYDVINLNFSNDTQVGVIYEHGFFDLDLGKYVYITQTNYSDYVGHKFVVMGDQETNTWETATLDSVEIETRTTTAWSPVSYKHLCYFTNGVLSMPGGIDGLFNIFEVNTETMSYDSAQKEADIAEYGLYTFEDFNGLIPEIAYESFNGEYLKVAVGKGLITWETIEMYANKYVPLIPSLVAENLLASE